MLVPGSEADLEPQFFQESPPYRDVNWGSRSETMSSGKGIVLENLLEQCLGDLESGRETREKNNHQRRGHQ